jgi:hypothetical protein
VVGVAAGCRDKVGGCDKVGDDFSWNSLKSDLPLICGPEGKGCVDFDILSGSSCLSNKGEAFECCLTKDGRTGMRRFSGVDASFKPLLGGID